MPHAQTIFLHLSFISKATIRIATLAALALPSSGDISIEGDLPQLKPGSRISILRESVADRQKSEVASIEVSEGGRVHADLALDPGLFELSFPNGKSKAVALDDGAAIRLIRDERAHSGIQVSGSPDTEKLEAYESFRGESLERLVYPVREQVSQAQADEIERLTNLEVARYDEHRRELNDFAIDEVGASVALYATSLRWHGDYRLKELEDLVNEFAKTRPQLELTGEMREKIATFQRLAIGARTPEASGQNLAGEEISLQQFRGRYVLLDFWASWCPPCRVENRHYRKLTDRLPPEEFQILSVNLDDSRRSWEVASRQDKISWPQISDTLGWKSPLAQSYNVTALPASFLIDPEGRIVARDLRGSQLDKVLDKVLGE